MRVIPHALGCRAYLSVGREVGALCVERLAVLIVPSLPHPLLSTVYQCDGCLSYQGHGGSELGCRLLPAISAVSILELRIPIVVAPGCLGHPHLHGLRRDLQIRLRLRVGVRLLSARGLGLSCRRHCCCPRQLATKIFQ